MDEAAAEHQEPEAIDAVAFEQLVVGGRQVTGKQQPGAKRLRLVSLLFRERRNDDLVFPRQPRKGLLLSRDEHRFKRGLRLLGFFLQVGEEAEVIGLAVSGDVGVVVALRT